MTTGAMAITGGSAAKAWILYAVSAILLIGTLGGLLSLAFPGPQDAAAIRLSAIVATVVQLAAFTVTQALSRRHLIAGWGVGSLLRFLTLVVYALLAVKALGLPAVAALVSLGVFLFLSTLIEPLFLRR